MVEAIDIIILTLMTMTVIAMVVMRNLMAVVALGGIYSLLAASVFVTLDAVDVAFTEAAVGAVCRGQRRGGRRGGLRDRRASQCADGAFRAGHARPFLVCRP